MRRMTGMALTFGALVTVAPAMAQTTSSTPAAPAATTAAPATTAAAGAPTDAEVAQFAKAAIGVDKVRKDTSLAEADKQKAMVSQIEASGLTAVRFNDIATKSQSDTALQGRIQIAIANEQKASASVQ
jgi:hypothetical protein